MKISQIKWIDGDKYKDPYGKIWEIRQKEMKYQKEDKTWEYITDGRYALGLILNMDFEKCNK